MRHNILSIAAAVALALVASCASAWNGTGHSVIAEIAWQQLTPELRQSIVETLKRHPRFGEDFIQRMPREVDGAGQETQDRWIFWHAATWPDVARGIRGPDRSVYDRGTWHYINGPIYLDRSDKNALAGRLTVNLSFDYPTAMAEREWNLVQATKHATAILRDAGAPAPERAVAYCWLFHLVGDSHQPLHSCALFSASRFPKGDRGGNDIPLTQGDKLHSLWDGLLGSTRNVNSVKRRAAELQDRDLYGDIWDSAAKTTDPKQWLSESYALAKGFVYDDAIRDVVRRATPQQPIEQIVVSDEYLKAAGGHARKRVLAAGLRLAAVLKEIEPKSSRITRATRPARRQPAATSAAIPMPASLAPSSAAPAAAPALTHWLNTKTGVRHNSSCRWFENTSGGSRCSANDGNPCQQCGG